MKELGDMTREDNSRLLKTSFQILKRVTGYTWYNDKQKTLKQEDDF